MRDQENLYERDYYAWTRAQAAELRRMARARSNTALDLVHLAEEVADLGKSERNAVRSQVRRIVEHLLKLEWSAASAPRALWRRSVTDARARLRDMLTPSLRHDLARRLPLLYEDARRLAADSLQDHEEEEATYLLPETCPYGLDEVLRDDWYPTNRHGADAAGATG